MAYMGNSPAEIYSSVQKQTITGDGTVGPYTLDYSVTNANEISVFVNNVRQEPGSGKAYTVSGDQLTMTGTVASTDDFYVIFSGLTQGTVTPPDASVTKAKMNTTELDLSTIKDGTGTNTAITINSSGIVTKAANPSFNVKLNSNFNTDGTPTKVTGWTENHDVGGCWDNTNSKFVAPVAGVYFFAFTGLFQTSSGTGRWGRVRFTHTPSGGSAATILDCISDRGTYDTYQRLSGTIAYQLGVNDEMTLLASSDQTSGVFLYGSNSYTVFSGFLIG